MCELTNQGLGIWWGGLKETGVKTEGEKSAAAEKTDVFIEHNMHPFIKMYACSDIKAYLKYNID